MAKNKTEIHVTTVFDGELDLSLIHISIRRCEIQGRNDTGENWRTDTEMIPKHNNLIGGQSTLSLIR